MLWTVSILRIVLISRTSDPETCVDLKQEAFTFKNCLNYFHYMTESSTELAAESRGPGVWS